MVGVNARTELGRIQFGAFSALVVVGENGRTWRKCDCEEIFSPFDFFLMSRSAPWWNCQKVSREVHSRPEGNIQF